jgi:peptidoglycan/LPS O-acetylase OafA/YrhL
VVVANPAAAAQAPGRFVALDSLRGLAALCIVFYHIGDFGWIAGLRPFRHGWMLVDFFFVLSGFVIAASYGGRLAQGYPRGRFLLVRLGRVYPLHIVTVALWVMLEFLVFRPVLLEAHSPTELVRGVFLLDAFARGAGNFYAPVSWAVAVELVLYVLAAGLFGRGRWAIALAVLVAGASAWALYTGFNELGFGRLLQRGLLGFPIGVACFWLHRRLAGVQPGPALLSIGECALLAALVWLLAAWGKSASWIPGADLLFAAIVLVFARDGGIASRALQWRPLVALGQLSFAIYMVHLFYVMLPNRFLPKLFAATGHDDWIRPGRQTFGLLSVDPPAWIATLITLAIVGLAVGTAWLAWRYIEEPARHWTRRFAPPSGAPPVPAI